MAERKRKCIRMWATTWLIGETGKLNDDRIAVLATTKKKAARILERLVPAAVGRVSLKRMQHVVVMGARKGRHAR